MAVCPQIPNISSSAMLPVVALFAAPAAPGVGLLLDLAAYPFALNALYQFRIADSARTEPRRKGTGRVAAAHPARGVAMQGTAGVNNTALPARFSMALRPSRFISPGACPMRSR